MINKTSVLLLHNFQYGQSLLKITFHLIVNLTYTTQVSCRLQAKEQAKKLLQDTSLHPRHKDESTHLKYMRATYQTITN